MAEKPPAKRKYDSSRRQEQARATRRQIAEAARGAFIERGYAGTTIAAIAQAAGVAPETVYAIFDSKRNILWHLMDIAVGGDDQPIRLMDRPEPQAVLRDPDPHRQLRVLSEKLAETLSRVAPILEVLRSAARSDPEIDALLQTLLKERLENLTTFTRHIAGLRAGLDASAAGVQVWAIASPEVFLLLTRDRGLSLEEYSNWLNATLSRLLLP